MENDMKVDQSYMWIDIFHLFSERVLRLLCQLVGLIKPLRMDLSLLHTMPKLLIQFLLGLNNSSKLLLL